MSETISEYMTIPKLAKETGLSDNTIRRYIENYRSFFRSQEIAGWEQFPAEETLKILRRISEESRAGRRRLEVVEVLRREFTEQNQPESRSYPIPAEMPIANVWELGPKTMGLFIEIRDLLREVMARKD